MERLPDGTAGDDENNASFPGSKNSETAGEERKSHLNRRNFIKYGAAAATAGVGMAGSASAADRYGVQFDRVIDAGNYDVDATGNTPIDDFLSANLDGSTAIEFPPGTYLITEFQHLTSGNLGIIGTGNSHRDVRFRCQQGGPVGNDGRWIQFSGNAVALANFSIDIRDDNQTAADMWLKGVSGTIENVEYVGRIPPQWNFGQSQLLAVYTGSRSDVLDINGLYVRGGAERVGYPDGLGGLRVGPGNDGETVIRNSHFEGINSSAIRHTKGDGIVTLRNTFFANNANTNIRVHPGDHPSKTSSIENCVVLIDGDLSRLPYSRDGDVFGGEGQPSTAIQLESEHNYGGAVYQDVDVLVSYDHPAGARVFRTGGGFGKAEGRTEFRNCRFGNPAGETWTVNMQYGGPFVFENSDFTGVGTIGGGSNVRLNDSCVDDTISIDASTSGVVRNGCIEPDADLGSLPNTVTIEGGPADYEFTVSGDLEKSDEGDVTIDDDDTIDGNTATGNVNGGADRYRFSGGITDFQFLAGEATVYVNGEQVDPATLGGLDNTITLEGRGTSTNYEFTVSDALEPNPDGGALEEWDDISGTTANGWVTESGHVDSYQFAGEVTDFAFHEGEATVYRNGEQVDPTGLGSSDNTLTIEGKGTSTNYEFTVSGDLEPNPDGGELEQWDDVSGSTANGWVTDSGHVDSFAFTGEVTDFAFLEGEATVYRNGEQVDPGTL